MTGGAGGFFNLPPLETRPGIAISVAGGDLAFFEEGGNTAAGRSISAAALASKSASDKELRTLLGLLLLLLLETDAPLSAFLRGSRFDSPAGAGAGFGAATV